MHGGKHRPRTLAKGLTVQRDVMDVEAVRESDPRRGVEARSDLEAPADVRAEAELLLARRQVGAVEPDELAVETSVHSDEATVLLGKREVLQLDAEPVDRAREPVVAVHEPGHGDGERAEVHA